MVISVEKDEEKAVLEHPCNLSLQRLRHDYNFKTRLSYIGDLVPRRRRRENGREVNKRTVLVDIWALVL